VENFVKSMTYPKALSVVTCGAAITGTWTAYGLGMSAAAARVRTVAPISAVKGSALLPISDVVVFDGLAGIRSWSPPV